MFISQHNIVDKKRKQCFMGKNLKGVNSVTRGLWLLVYFCNRGFYVEFTL